MGQQGHSVAGNGHGGHNSDVATAPAGIDVDGGRDLVPSSNGHRTGTAPPSPLARLSPREWAWSAVVVLLLLGGALVLASELVDGLNPTWTAVATLALAAWIVALGPARAASGTGEPAASSGDPRSVRIDEEPLTTEAFFRELERGRRYSRGFSILRINVAREAMASPRARAWARRDGAVARRLRSAVRSIDVVLERHGTAYILLPEGERDHAEGVVRRIQERQVVPVSEDSVRVAVFPEDGVTIPALLRVLQASPAVQSIAADQVRAAGNGEL
ncbi:hypothetical protein BH23ACT7_BH23ACT7_28260 [soil metagenome]